MKKSRRDWKKSKSPKVTVVHRGEEEEEEEEEPENNKE